MKSGIKLSDLQYRPLMMSYIDTGFTIDGEKYWDVYKAIYSLMIPSRRDMIMNSTIKELREMAISREHFDIDHTDDELINGLLLKVIRAKYDTCPLFREVLWRTGNEPLITCEYDDTFFGGYANRYGKALAKFRDEYANEDRDRRDDDPILPSTQEELEKFMERNKIKQSEKKALSHNFIHGKGHMYSKYHINKRKYNESRQIIPINGSIRKVPITTLQRCMQNC